MSPTSRRGPLAVVGVLLSLGCVGTGPGGEGAEPPNPGFVAAVTTPTADGSGLLLPGDRLVTSAHAVWPHRQVDVRFSNGAEGRGAPVVAVDWMADIALVDVSGVAELPGPGSLSSTVSRPGEPVYLAGHDASGPVLLPGAVTEVRTWEDAGFDLLLTDIGIPAGSSGGGLIDGSGAIVGITGLSVDGSAMALASPVVAERLAATSPSRWPTAPQVPATGPEISSNVFDEVTYAFDGSPGSTVTFSWRTEIRSVAVIAPDGVLEATEEDLEGGTITVTVEREGVHFLSILPRRPAVIATEASVPLRVVRDVERAEEIGAGRREGISDYPGDLDWFVLPVVADAEVLLTVSSTNMNPAVAVVFEDDPDPVMSDSDSGAGVLGWDAALALTTTRPGRLLVAVFDEGQFGPGAYVLTVDIGP